MDLLLMKACLLKTLPYSWYSVGTSCCHGHAVLLTVSVTSIVALVVH
jgi:hypothetical protein